MKRFAASILVFLFFQVHHLFAQSVGINDDASLPNPTAILDIKVAGAQKKGVLMPRMTSSERLAIINPAKGLIVYDSSVNGYWFHNGNSWQQLSTGTQNPWLSNGANIYNRNIGNVGIGTLSPKAKLNVGGNQAVLFGESLSGLGVKAFWMPYRAAFRAGSVAGGWFSDPPFVWDTVNIGFGSFASGGDPMAKGNFSAAFGSATFATGVNSFVTGIASSAKGDHSFASGYFSVASGEASFAANESSAAGDRSASFNQGGATGALSFAAGRGTEARAANSFVLGENNDPILAAPEALENTSSSPIFIIGNGKIWEEKRNALVVLKSGKTGIGLNPGNDSTNDATLQVKQIGPSAALELAAPTGSNNWSFKVASSMSLYFKNSLRGTFNSTTGVYTNISDERLKKDIESLSPVLEKVMTLKTYSYHLLDNQDGAERSYGLMAQQVQKVFPDLVSPIEDNAGHQYLGLNYQGLNVVAVKAIQEQQAIIAKLQDKLRLQQEIIAAQELRLQRIERMLRSDD